MEKQDSLIYRPNITEVVKEFGSRLKGFIRKRVNSAEDAEDVLQDVYYQLAEAYQLSRPIEQISAWLYTVARNKITDLYRKNKPEPVAEFYSDNDDEEMLSEISDLLTSTDNSPDVEFLKSLVWKELQKALNELPEEQRIVFEMNELEGIPFKEIAKITGEPESTLITRKRYAVLYLRERLRDLYEELMEF